MSSEGEVTTDGLSEPFNKEITSHNTLVTELGELYHNNIVTYTNMYHTIFTSLIIGGMSIVI